MTGIPFLVTVEDVLLWIGGVVMPDGDPARARQAAQACHELAARLDASGTSMHNVAADVWTNNHGRAVNDFQTFWTKNGGIGQYPGDLAAYFRKLEAACLGYANALEEIQFALVVLAVQTYLNIFYTFAYGWVTGYSAIMAEWVIIQLRARNIALLEIAAFRVALEKILQYLLDSLMYAGGQQILQLGTFAVASLFGKYDQTTDKVFGFDPYSPSANLKQFIESFAGNVAFDLSLDTVFAPLTRAIPRVGRAMAGNPAGMVSRFAGFVDRMAGSGLYTVVSNLIGDELSPPTPGSWYASGTSSSWYPNAMAWVDKFFIHGGRMAKNPALGPIFYKPEL